MASICSLFTRLPSQKPRAARAAPRGPLIRVGSVRYCFDRKREKRRPKTKTSHSSSAWSVGSVGVTCNILPLPPSPSYIQPGPRVATLAPLADLHPWRAQPPPPAVHHVLGSASPKNFHARRLLPRRRGSAATCAIRFHDLLAITPEPSMSNCLLNRFRRASSVGCLRRPIKAKSER